MSITLPARSPTDPIPDDHTSALPRSTGPDFPHPTDAEMVPAPWRVTKAVYRALSEVGFDPCPNKRPELIDGVIYVTPAPRAPHYYTSRSVAEALRTIFGNGFDVRHEGALNSPGDNEPIPDITVVPGHYRDFEHEHPSKAVLVCEVALTSHAHDLQRKPDLYAFSGVPEYWVVDLVRRRLEAFRNPETYDSALSQFGYRYQTHLVIPETGTVLPQAAPAGAVPLLVSSFLPSIRS